MTNRFIVNSFQMPNVIIDEFLSKISGNAFKCYGLISRQTTGWQKQSDRISVSQFMAKCNIKDKRTAYSCLAELEEIGLIVTFKKLGEITEFSLNFNFENPESEPVTKNATGSKKCSEPVTKNATGTSGKKCHSTKDNIKNNITNNNLTVITKAPTKSIDLNVLEQFGITGQLAEDFIKHRKACKAPITKTALNGFQREADKAGISIQEAVAISIERGWRGFKADWDWGGNKPVVKSSQKPKFSDDDPSWWQGKTIDIREW